MSREEALVRILKARLLSAHKEREGLELRLAKVRELCAEAQAHEAAYVGVREVLEAVDGDWPGLVDP